MRYKSEEARKRVQVAVSKAHKGKIVSDETRKKQSEAKRGKPLSEEHKKSLSDALIGRSFPKPKNPNKLWGSFDELYEIWLKVEQPEWKKFKRIAVSLGYPDRSYCAMIKHFKERYEKEEHIIRIPESSLVNFGLL